MSGKSRYGGVISSAARYDPEAKDSPTVAATISTEAVQASWAQYVQRLVSEQIAEIRHGVIEGLREGINEQVGRLRRERDSNSAKLERALADIRAAKAEMREAIRTELRAEIRTEIADRVR